MSKDLFLFILTYEESNINLLILYKRSIAAKTEDLSNLDMTLVDNDKTQKTTYGPLYFLSDDSVP